MVLKTISRIIEELKREPNKDIELKDNFETAF